MDWAGAIKINHAALTRIVLGLIAMVGLTDSGTLARLPRPLYLAVARVLRPAELAVRRLIVIAARGLVVKVSPARPMPKGLAPGRKGSGRVSFPLFDTRKRFGLARRKLTKLQPRIHVFCAPPPLVPFFQPRPAVNPVPEPDNGSVDALRLGRRLAAVKMALETLPRQAKRLARWRARHSGMPILALKSPLRPGRPPGHREKPKDEVDGVLKECHALAWDALKEDTS